MAEYELIRDEKVAKENVEVTITNASLTWGFKIRQ